MSYNITQYSCFLLFAFSVDDETRSTSAKVIRHVDGPSGWVVSPRKGDLHGSERDIEPISTHGEPSRNHLTSKPTEDSLEERGLVGKQVGGVIVWHAENEVWGTFNLYDRKVAISIIILLLHSIEGERFVILFRLADCVVLPKGITIFCYKGHKNSRPKDSFVVCRGTLAWILVRVLISIWWLLSFVAWNPTETHRLRYCRTHFNNPRLLLVIITCISFTWWLSKQDGSATFNNPRRVWMVL